MKTLLISFALLLFAPSQNDVQESNDTYVYICTGKYAYSYHSTNTCRGLNRCSAEIKKVTLEQAKKKGRTPCDICY